MAFTYFKVKFKGKVKFVKCFCLFPMVLVLVLVLLFWSWSWSCKQRSWSWSCYFGLGLKNLVLFTSLPKTSSPRPMTQKGIIWHNAKCARKDNVTHYVFSQYMAHSNVHCVMYCSALYNGYVKCSAVQYSGFNTKTRTTDVRSQAHVSPLETTSLRWRRRYVLCREPVELTFLALTRFL